VSEDVPARPGLGQVRRRAVDSTRLVETGFAPGAEGRLPLVVTPAVDGVDLARWCAANAAELEAHLDRHGAVLFRGFPLEGVDDFERVAITIAPDLFAEYGDLPPESASARVYGSTPYPPDKTILFHNESSHLPTWPLRQFFFCAVPAAEGGETPLLDCREAYRELEPELREEFERKGLLYVRNFVGGVDVSWQEFFRTTDSAEVERTCRESGMDFEWAHDDGLRVRQASPAVVTHPRTGERVFFNQIQLHHPSCLDPETRAALRQLFADEDLPRNVLFGDGAPIPDEAVDEIGRLYERLCVEQPWAEGDLIALDNMLVSHARRPFAGPRKILVAMGRMVGAAA